MEEESNPKYFNSASTRSAVSKEKIKEYNGINYNKEERWYKYLHYCIHLFEIQVKPQGHSFFMKGGFNQNNLL